MLGAAFGREGAAGGTDLGLERRLGLGWRPGVIMPFDDIVRSLGGISSFVMESSSPIDAWDQADLKTERK